MANKKHDSNNNKPVKKYLELFYMTPSQIRAKDIAELLNASDYYGLELWDDMNVLELELSEQSSVDLEPVNIDFKDPSDAAFVKNRNIRTIFGVNLAEEDLTEVIKLFEKIADRYAGFLCSDSADFNPVYVGSAAKPVN